MNPNYIDTNLDIVMDDKQERLYKELKELQSKVSKKEQELNSYLEEVKKKNMNVLSNKYKQSFLKDVKLFNDISQPIELGLKLNTPHYKIYFTDHSIEFWTAELTDKHKNKEFASIWLLKSENETVKDALQEIAYNIVDYELHHNFKGIG